MKPLRGLGLVVCDPPLVFAVIDALFGGAGKYPTRIEGRDFSATEQKVIRRLVDVIMGDYKRAWEGIYQLELDYVRSEMQPQFANIAQPSEIADLERERGRDDDLRRLGDVGELRLHLRAQVVELELDRCLPRRACSRP